MTTEFSQLSDEVLMNILTILSPKELTRLRRTCKRLCKLAGDEGIWENLLIKDYNLTRNSLWSGWPAEEMYKIVHKFRELLGVWHCDFSHFGLFVRVSIEKNGIVAYDCAPPLDDIVLDAPGLGGLVTVNSEVNYDDVERLHRFRYRPLFALVPEIATTRVPNHRISVRFVCYHSSVGAHSAQEGASQTNGPNVPEAIDCLQKTDGGFVFVCKNKEEHRPLDTRYWLEWEHGFRLNSDDQICLDNVLSILRDQKEYEMRLEKFESKASLDQFSLTRHFQHTFPTFGAPVVHQPVSLASPLVTAPTASCGLYFGHFNNWHGWQLLTLYYDDDGWTLVGDKVTGDLMIPVGRTSFRASLSQNVFLDYADLSTIATVRSALRRNALTRTSTHNNVHNHQPSVNGYEPTVSHPFRVPTDCSILGAKRVPDTCVSYFLADGQIAFPNFCNPRFLACVLVVFNDDQIGLLWLDLKCFMPMYKMKWS